MLNKIAIVFGDNDFYNTFYCVLNTILTAHEYSGPLDLTKEQLCEVINSMSVGHYLLFQSKFQGPNFQDGFLSNYLRIYPEKVAKKQKEWSLFEPYILINEEVDDYVKSDIFWNGESFFVYLEEKLIFSR